MRSTAVISSKGQIVIPANLRKIPPGKGSHLVFQEERGRLVLDPNNFETIYALQGSLKEFPIEASLEEERRIERKPWGRAMKDYVLGANAIIRYFGVGDGQSGEKVRGLFEQATGNQARVSMSVINIGEVLYILLKHLGEQRAFQYIQALHHAPTMIEADSNRTIEAARLKHQFKLGYADSFRRRPGLGIKGYARLRRPR
jgi:hypothetical protein